MVSPLGADGGAAQILELLKNAAPSWTLQGRRGSKPFRPDVLISSLADAGVGFLEALSVYGDVVRAGMQRFPEAGPVTAIDVHYLVVEVLLASPDPRAPTWLANYSTGYQTALLSVETSPSGDQVGTDVGDRSAIRQRIGVVVQDRLIAMGAVSEKHLIVDSISDLSEHVTRVLDGLRIDRADDEVIKKVVDLIGSSSSRAFIPGHGREGWAEEALGVADSMLQHARRKADSAAPRGQVLTTLLTALAPVLGAFLRQYGVLPRESPQGLIAQAKAFCEAARTAQSGVLQQQWRTLEQSVRRYGFSPHDVRRALDEFSHSMDELRAMLKDGDDESSTIEQARKLTDSATSLVQMVRIALETDRLLHSVRTSLEDRPFDFDAFARALEGIAADSGLQARKSDVNGSPTVRIQPRTRGSRLLDLFAGVEVAVATEHGDQLDERVRMFATGDRREYLTVVVAADLDSSRGASRSLSRELVEYLVGRIPNGVVVFPTGVTPFLRWVASREGMIDAFYSKVRGSPWGPELSALEAVAPKPVVVPDPPIASRSRGLFEAVREHLSARISQLENQVTATPHGASEFEKELKDARSLMDLLEDAATAPEPNRREQVREIGRRAGLTDEQLRVLAGD